MWNAADFKVASHEYCFHLRILPYASSLPAHMLFDLCSNVMQAPPPVESLLAAYRAPAFRVSESELEALLAEARSISTALDSPHPLAALVSTCLKEIKTVPVIDLFLALYFGCTTFIWIVTCLSIIDGVREAPWCRRCFSLASLEVTSQCYRTSF